MTDEEVADLLRTLSAQRLAAWQRGERRTTIPPDELAEIDGNISKMIWYIGAIPSIDQVRAAGASEGQISKALAEKKHALGIIEKSDLVEIPADLAAEINQDLQIIMVEEPETGLRRLDEKVVDWIKEYRVEIYLNESQHRGRPHVAVVLPDGKISVSLENPPALLTPHGYRGEASALKVVKKHRKRLRKLWDDTRPDDQKLLATAAPAQPVTISTKPSGKKSPKAKPHR